MANHPLKGSERTPLPGATAVGKADPAERLEVTIILRRRTADALKAQVAKLAAGERSATHLTREEFAKQFGADPGDIDVVKKFAQEHELAAVQVDPARRTIVLAGTVSQFNQAFGVELKRFEHDGGTYRGRTGPVYLPNELQGVVEAVMGLDNRPQERPQFRVRPPQGNVQWRAAATAFTPPQLASLYHFPDATGQGECIAIVELGGG